MKLALVVLALVLACAVSETPETPVVEAPAEIPHPPVADTSLVAYMARMVDAPVLAPGDDELIEIMAHFRSEWAAAIEWWRKLTPEQREAALHRIRYELALAGITCPYVWESSSGQLYSTSEDGTSLLAPLR
jgi:hypothetical protein